MTTHGIPLDQAELLSVILEALLYGFSLLMFAATVWVLFARRSTDQVNYKMLTVACALLLCSTMHIVINIIRIMQGFILYRETYEVLGGPIAYFANVAQWTFLARGYVYGVQTLIGDGVILYRCYVVWQSKLIMVLPVLLWCAVGVTGIAVPYVASKAAQSEVFVGELARWITSFGVMELITSLLTTVLLALRIWYIDRKAAGFRSHRNSQLRQILHVIIDAGAIYTLALVVVMICFESRDNGQFVVVEMITPIISITFYMVIIRVGLANWVNNSTSGALGYASTSDAMSAERRRGVQIHVMQLTESKIDRDQNSLTRPTSPTCSAENYQNSSEIKFENGGEVV